MITEELTLVTLIVRQNDRGKFRTRTQTNKSIREFPGITHLSLLR